MGKQIYSKAYSQLEHHIINIFKQEGQFVFSKSTYTLITACKPSSPKGECKTDVYVKGISSTGDVLELKISVKSKSTNEFQDNKITADKAEKYFGADWESVIETASKSIRKQFESRPLIYISGSHPTKPNSITLGWKLEIASKPRSLSASIPLSITEIRNYVYRGTNQDTSKKNAYVDGCVVKNSGVADYMLISEISSLKSTADIIASLKLIDSYTPPTSYLIFTANNYRTDVDKADGPRALAIHINWKCENKKLTPNIQFSNPLQYTGEGNMKPILLRALNALGKKHPKDFDINRDVCDPKIVMK